MAIIASLPGVEVEITISGSALRELEDGASPDLHNTALRYVEVQSDQHFDIRVSTSPGAIRGAGLGYKIFIDGTYANGVIIQPHHCEDESYEWWSRGWDLGNGLVGRYYLTVFETDDVNGIKEVTEATKSLGVIEIKVFHVSKVTETRRADSPYSVQVSLDPVSEKAVKFQELSHTVSMGEAIQYGQGGGRSVDVEYMSDDPIGVFKFLYRSKERLENLHILERTPPPPPIEEREAASLSEGDVGELQRRLREVNQRNEVLLRIKREELNNNRRRRSSASTPSQLEVIDLEEDVEIRREVLDGKPRRRRYASLSDSIEVVDLEKESVEVKREVADEFQRPTKAARRSGKIQVIELD